MTGTDQLCPICCHTERVVPTPWHIPHHGLTNRQGIPDVLIRRLFGRLWRRKHAVQRRISSAPARPDTDSTRRRGWVPFGRAVGAASGKSPLRAGSGCELAAADSGGGATDGRRFLFRRPRPVGVGQRDRADQELGVGVLRLPGPPARRRPPRRRSRGTAR